MLVVIADRWTCMQTDTLIAILRSQTGSAPLDFVDSVVYSDFLTRGMVAMLDGGVADQTRFANVPS